MKLTKVKIAVLAAVAIIGLLAVSAFAACPPGTIDLTATPTGNNSIAAGAIYEIHDPGTYCVPGTGVTAGTDLGGKSGTSTNAPAKTIEVMASNVTIVGENPYATLTGDNGVTGAIITVNAGMTGVVIHNFTLRSGDTASANNDGIDAAGTVIEGMTFNDGTVGFKNYAV